MAITAIIQDVIVNFVQTAMLIFGLVLISSVFFGESYIDDIMIETTQGQVVDRGIKHSAVISIDDETLEFVADSTKTPIEAENISRLNRTAVHGIVSALQSRDLASVIVIDIIADPLQSAGRNAALFPKLDLGRCNTPVVIAMRVVDRYAGNPVREPDERFLDKNAKCVFPAVPMIQSGVDRPVLRSLVGKYALPESSISYLSLPSAARVAIGVPTSRPLSFNRRAALLNHRCAEDFSCAKLSRSTAVFRPDNPAGPSPFVLSGVDLLMPERVQSSISLLEGRAVFIGETHSMSQDLVRLPGTLIRTWWRGETEGTLVHGVFAQEMSFRQLMNTPGQSGLIIRLGGWITSFLALTIYFASAATRPAVGLVQTRQWDWMLLWPSWRTGIAAAILFLLISWLMLELFAVLSNIVIGISIIAVVGTVLHRFNPLPGDITASV